MSFNDASALMEPTLNCFSHDTLIVSRFIPERFPVEFSSGTKENRQKLMED